MVYPEHNYMPSGIHSSRGLWAGRQGLLSWFLGPGARPDPEKNRPLRFLRQGDVCEGG